MTAADEGSAGNPSPAWADAWFPVAFERDVEADRVQPVRVAGRRIALFRDEDGAVSALDDRCPHRGALLSDGRVRAGTLECLYHGWRFDGAGRCVEAPQQPRDRPLPEGAYARRVDLCVEQGIVWVWGGAPGAGAAVARPTVPALEREGVRSVDFTMDLPYGQDFFVENVLDVAHIHVAHSGTRGGGDRSLAGPLEFDVEPMTEEGFAARFHTRDLDGSRRTPGLVGAGVAFVAPNLVHYVSEFEDPALVSGLALYSIPIDAGSCRMVYRAYGNLWTDRDRRRPRWREHLEQCFLLEEDMAVVRGQAAEIDGSSEPLATMWNPLRTSDRLVVLYREWVERHAPGRPGAVGFRTAGQRGVLTEGAATDRWTLHARHCRDCRDALERAQRAWPRLAAASFGLVLVAALAPSPLAFFAAAGAAGCAAAAVRGHDRARSFTMERRLPGA